MIYMSPNVSRFRFCTAVVDLGVAKLICSQNYWGPVYFAWQGVGKVGLGGWWGQ